MPHYKGGTAAAVGDVVRGKGYNVKDPSTGELAEIIALVTGVVPGAETCNLSMLLPDGVLGHFTTSRSDLAGSNTIVGHVVTGRFEYGQADHFEKVV